MIYLFRFMKPFFFTLGILVLFTGCDLIDDSPLDNNVGIGYFASGPRESGYYDYAKGIIDASGETLGIFLENSSGSGTLENAAKLVSGDTFMGVAYMGIVQEDVFDYARRRYEAQYQANPATAEKRYLKIASQVKVLMALYNEDLFLLVNEGSGISAVTDITAAHTVNLGAVGSNTYLTATTVLDAHKLSYITTTDDAETGIAAVVAGTCDAAFLVAASPSSILQEIPSTATVKLIRVQMPESYKLYNENGTIIADDYPFQDTDISKNIRVKTLLAVGPRFEDSSVPLLLDYIYTHAEEYQAYSGLWSDLSLGMSLEYMRENPQKANYRALAHISAFPEVDQFYLGPYFYSEYGVSAYHDMATELIWLTSHNLDIDLREKNSTGTWENSYRMLNGDASMALVQDDIFPYLKSSDEIYESMQTATMQKVAPLHYEYVHLLVNRNNYLTSGQGWYAWVNSTWNGLIDPTDADQWVVSGQTYPSGLMDIFLDPAPGNAAQPVLHINVGPKTSGTFITAMAIINSYRTRNSNNLDNPDVTDMEQMEIHYHFDEPAVAVQKVQDGTYHMAFVVTGAPYHKFYSHDTWDIAADLSNCVLIPATFYDPEGDGSADNTPYPYRIGTLAGGGAAQFENYPYPSLILPADIATVRVRAMLVASAAFDDADIDVLINSIFRKGYYKIYPADPADLDFMPDPLWVAVRKENVTPPAGSPPYSYPEYDTYRETIIGAKEYFVKNPYGWSREAARYYLTMFPGD